LYNVFDSKGEKMNQENDSQTKVYQLKIRAYDLITLMEKVRAELNQVNTQIARLEQEIVQQQEADKSIPEVEDESTK